MYQEGGIVSPDGRCHPYDARAAGTVRGNGVALVVLQRLEDALHDGGLVRAVIRGSAINNDGNLKVGYTAPSGAGQAAVIAEAHAIAGVSPETITYIEGHGTGTKLGDPIEVEALTRSFRAATQKKSFCMLGSIKANVGHLDTAAGVTGLIKTVLALENGLIPPHPSFRSANPAIDLVESPFQVNDTLREWKPCGHPRRAAVSSFGIGGTNAHVVLEEAPASEASSPSRSQQLIVLSAKTPAALRQSEEKLAAHLDQSAVSLPDVAYTLANGRGCFTHRRAVVGANAQEVAAMLRSPLARPSAGVDSDVPVAFIFPGQGSRFDGIGAELYETEPVFRGFVDRCAQQLTGFDIRSVLNVGQSPQDDGRQQAYTQQALFVVEMALASLWMHWGVRPAYLLGHSLGEYAAACIAGVMSLDDALEIVALRGQMIDDLPPGAMSAVHAAPETIRPLLRDTADIAACNGPALSVISGSPDDVARAEAELNRREIRFSRLPAARAFHSRMMDTVTARFEHALRKYSFHAPQIPLVSDVTGKWIEPGQAVDAAYWAAHLRQPVQFAAGVETLLQVSKVMIVEAGPGQTLSRIVQYNGVSGERAVLPTLPDRPGSALEVRCMLQSLGKLWEAGVPVDWEAFYRDEHRRRVILPGYPFQRERYWIDRAAMVFTNPENPLNGSTSAPESRRLLGDRGRVPNMSADVTTVATTAEPAQSSASLATLKTLVLNLTGEAELVDVDATFFQLGADSLTLVQLVHSVREELGVKVPFRALFEDLSTIRLLAEHIDREGVSIAPASTKTTARTSEVALPAASVADTEHDLGSTEVLPVAPVRATVSIVDSLAEPGTERLMRHQLDVLSQLCARQLEALRGTKSEAIPNAAAAAEQSRQVAPPAKTRDAALGQRTNQNRRADELTIEQSTYLKEFMHSYESRTGLSKAHVERYRDRFAEARTSTNFRMMWKELVYPIVAQGSSGSRIYDLDGNEYVDIAMGFGVDLFGHTPGFVKQALQRQLDQGFQVGPESASAGEVAELICELTGMDRVAFCNSGTEAVMGALRLARTVTNRSKVVIFEGSYHGTFDGILAKAAAGKPIGTAAPRCSGVPGSLLAEVVVLPYAEEAALTFIEQHARELAAVLVEPVQSRRPDLQPRQFLHALREITARSGAALIFDEVITGFRCHPGGAQAWFGVEADMATYGKVIGGGMPIGAVAGRHPFLDAIDGGSWRFRDSSSPLADQTFFAGTFWKHPLAMASALAVLRHLQAEGPQLQEALTEKTAMLASTLNALFQQEQVPLSVKHFASLFLVVPTEPWIYLDLFFYHLVHRGVYVWEGRTCYLSTGHSTQDIQRVVEAVSNAVNDLKRGGFLPAGRQPVSVPPARIPALRDAAFRHGHRMAVPASDGQKQLYFLSQTNPETSAAYHDSVSLRLKGPLNLVALRTAAQQLIDQFEILRTALNDDGSLQVIHEAQSVEIPLLDFSRTSPDRQDQEVASWLADEVQLPFQLNKPLLIRFKVLKLGAQEHLLAITSHHVITDDRSYTVLLNGLAELYAAARQGTEPPDLKPLQYRDYQQAQERALDEERIKEDEEYWKAQFGQGFPVLQLPSDRGGKGGPSLSTQRLVETIPLDLVTTLRRISADQSCTFYMTLLTAYGILLRILSGQKAFPVGINVSQQLTANTENLVGYHINPLSLLYHCEDAVSLRQAMRRTKQLVLEANTHQALSVSRLKKALDLHGAAGTQLLAKTVFNLDRMGGRTQFYDLSCELRGNKPGFSPHELVCNVLEHREKLEILFDYRSALFAEQSVQVWLKMFRKIMEMMAADVDAPLVSVVAALGGIHTTAKAAPPTPISGRIYEQSRSQKIIWAGQHFHPSLPLFVNAGYCIVASEVDPALYREVIAALLDRCDALRMVVVEKDGQAYMSVKDIHSTPDVIDLSGASDPDAALAEWAERRSRVPFELHKKLFDFALLKLAPQRFAYFVNLHHLISDAWAVAAVFQRIREFCELAASGRLQDAPAMPAFADYLEQDRALAQSAECIKARAYWDAKLSQKLDAINFYGRMPVRQRAYEVVRVSCHLGRGRSAGINHQARISAPGMSPDAAGHNLFAALMVTLLHQVSGLDYLGLGAPFHNRRGREDVIGLLMQIVPLRVRVQAADSIPAIARSVGIERINNLRHRSHVIGNPSSKLAYQVEFNFIHARHPDQFMGARVENAWVHPGYGVDLLAVQVRVDENDQYVCEFDCSTDVFDAELRNRLTQDFLGLLDDFLRDPNQPVADYVLRSSPAAALSPQAVMPVRAPEERFVQVFEAQAKRSPLRVAASFQDEVITYATLNEKAAELASRLRHMGVGTESLVGFHADRNIAYLVGVLGILKSGAAYLPLDPGLPKARLSKLIGAAKPELILYAQQHETTVLEAIKAPGSPSSIRILPVKGAVASVSTAAPACNLIGNNLAYCFYTSGSSGEPKGAMIEHAGMLNHLRSKVNDLAITPGDVVAQSAPAFFDVAVWQFLAPLMIGARTEIIEEAAVRDPVRLLERLEDRGITVLEVVPSQLRAILQWLDSGNAARPALSKLRLLFAMGEVLPPELCQSWMEYFPHCRIVNAYGTTEVSDDVTHHYLAGPPQQGERIPVGTAIPNTRLHVVSAAMEAVEHGTEGELYIGGLCVGRGYRGDAARTAASFVPDPFSDQPGQRLYRTGDRVRLLPGEVLDFIGRADFQVKVRGQRVEPGEVEHALERHEAVRQAVVLAEQSDGTQQLVAYIAPRDPAAEGTLRTHLKEFLPEYMVPSRWEFIDEMPLTSNGKLDRLALANIGAKKAPTPLEPEGSIEEKLAAIWKRVLRLEYLELDDNFFELGGDSILSIQIVALARTAGVVITPTQLFEHQTVRALAEVAQAVESAAGDQRPVTGPVPLTPIQHWFLRQPVTDRNQWTHSMLIDLPAQTGPQIVREAIEALLLHHDALRLQCVEAGNAWEQQNLPVEGIADPLRVVNVDSSMNVEEQIHQHESEARDRIDLVQGRIFQAVCFVGGDGLASHLLLVVHHMAVDGVSWRILLEDLQTGLRQLSRGETVSLPAKTASYKQWAEQMHRFAQSDEIKDQFDYWTQDSSVELARLHKDRVDGQNRFETSGVISGTVPSKTTAALLKRLPQEYHIPVEAFLVAAFGHALRPMASGSLLKIALEGHGREQAGQACDISRTVGWFTSIYPLLLDLAQQPFGIWASRQVREQLRSVPGRGIGYELLRYLCEDADVQRALEEAPPAEVSFNYLGRFDGAEGGDSLLGNSGVKQDFQSRVAGTRSYLIDFNVLVWKDELHCEVGYSRGVYDDETMTLLLRRFTDALDSLAKVAGEDSSAAMNNPIPPSVVEAENDFGWTEEELAQISESLGD
jgi:amino acid adenylation domain-containing protein/non-ribosomal peptide synthase protein (TIGR01720 family)